MTSWQQHPRRKPLLSKRNAATTNSSDHHLSQYCASLILGAGLLTLPAEAARVGLLPLLGVLLPVWVASRFCYLRITRVLGQSPDAGHRS
jgi:amino acid permease